MGHSIFYPPSPSSPMEGIINLIISRGTLSESDILIMIKGFGINILPTRACLNFGSLGLLQGLQELGG